MITIPSLSDVSDILDTDQVMITNNQGQSYKIAGSELNKRHKVIMASSTTVTGALLKTGNPVRIYFTADITAVNATTTMQIKYNNVNYYVKVPKEGALANYVAFNLGGSPAVFKYVQAYTTLELLFDGTQFIIMCNPVVISGTNFSIYADGLKRVDEVTENGTDLVTSHAVAAAINKVKDIMSSLPTDAVLHYSFDDMPDYPDGTSLYTKDKDFTDLDGWTGASTTLTVENGTIKLQSNGDRQIVLMTKSILTSENLRLKLARVKIKSDFSITEVKFQVQAGVYPSYNLKFISKEMNEYTYAGIMPSDMLGGTSYLVVSFPTTSENNICYVEQIYIGDGSYSTPIIDNAYGQNNAVNNGGIAVKGVSGKGAYFLNGKYADIGTDFQFSPNFSISVWVKPSELSETYSVILRKDNVFGLVNGRSWDNALIVFLYGSGGVLLEAQRLGIIQRNQLLHIVITREGTTLKAYKDGVLTNTFTLADSTIATSANSLRIGDSITTKSQMVDDLLIFDRALTETEVMALYLNRGNTPKYYSWADWKLSQTENVQSRNVNLIQETPTTTEESER